MDERNIVHREITSDTDVPDGVAPPAGVCGRAGEEFANQVGLDRGDIEVAAAPAGGEADPVPWVIDSGRDQQGPDVLACGGRQRCGARDQAQTAGNRRIGPAAGCWARVGFP
ncbi:hypothetical protein [Streptomyces sp. NPDC040750]|uniref:hypothetical protein n=1 Tax=Streptomyces sp. NPDC040750 TaxID=3154491 RepID=UPI0033F696E9